MSSKKVSTCVIFVMFALINLQTTCVSGEINPSEIEVELNLSPADISKAMYESRKIGGMDGCISFGTRLAHQSLRNGGVTDTNLFESSKDAAKLVNPTLNATLRLLDQMSFNLKAQAITYTKNCQVQFGWEYFTANPKYYSEFKEDPTRIHSFTGEELAQMTSLGDLLPAGH